MKATLKRYRQSPRKVRLLTQVVKGKRVPEALTALLHLSKRASEPLRKLIASAAANAKVNNGAEIDTLVVKQVTVDEGFVFKRFQPRARGRAAPIRKRTSHISVILEKMTEKNQESRSKNKGKRKRP